MDGYGALVGGGLGCVDEIYFADVGIDNVVLSVTIDDAVELNQSVEVSRIVYFPTALAVRFEIDLGRGAVKDQGLEGHRAV